MTQIKNMTSPEIVLLIKDTFRDWYADHMSDSKADVQWRHAATLLDQMLINELAARGVAEPTIYELEQH